MTSPDPIQGVDSTWLGWHENTPIMRRLAFVMWLASLGPNPRTQRFLGLCGYETFSARIDDEDGVLWVGWAQ